MRSHRCRVLVGLAAALLGSACAEPTTATPPVGVPTPPARAVPAPNRDVIAAFRKRGLDAREVEEGVIIYLPTVYLFSFNDASVDAEAKGQLKGIATMLEEPLLAGRRVVVEGHADAVGGETYNQVLSERRAEAVMAELVAGGVKSGRLVKRAYGKERPLEPNRRPDGTDNPEGRARNRRVALIIENPAR